MIKSLYIHIPFCRKRCLYCDFYSQTNLKLKKSYLKALAREANSYRKFPALLETIYVGGGTPSLLTAEDFKFLFENVIWPFAKTNSCEITVEVNPDSTDKHLLNVLKNLGVNRLSIGFQFLSDRLLVKSGRLHTGRKAVKSFELARKSGFNNINVDILYGFPTQRISELENTLNKIIGLNPEHISAYLYTRPQRKPHTIVSAELRGKPPAAFGKENPDDLDMYRLVCKKLEKAKFRHYEISNFAKRNFFSKHNLNYWNGRGYIGLGAGATGTFKNLRIKNKDITSYIRNPLKKEEEYLTEKKRNFEKKFLALRTSRGIPYEKNQDEFIRMGWLKKESGRVRFTQEGWFVSNSVISEIV
ncbi:MAG: radical SAM family heme chaperone HemW [bacterium]